MKTDLYTKVVLTVIAGCLILIAAEKGAVPTANASSPPAGYSLVPVNEDGAINVRVISAAQPQEVLLVGWTENYYTTRNKEVHALGAGGLPVHGK